MRWAGWLWVQISALQCQGSWVCISMCEAQDLLALRSVCSRRSFPIHSRLDENFWGKFQFCDDSWRILTAFLHLRENAAGIIEEFSKFSKCWLVEQWSELVCLSWTFHIVHFFYSYPLNIVLKGFLHSCSGNTVRLCLGGLRKL